MAPGIPTVPKIFRAAARFALLLLLLSPGAAAAGDRPLIEQATDPAVKDAINNAHHEMVICAAFWAISAQGLRQKDPNSEAAVGVDQHAGALMSALRLLHSDEVSLARYEMALADQMERMKRDFSNFSLLLADHLEPCKAIGASPSDFVLKRIKAAGG